MIKADDLIAIFTMMCREKWQYIWGKAEEGIVDCSGAFVYAYRQLGKTIAHGSNTIARKHVGPMLPISQAKPGMAAFKARPPGSSGYKLPAKFAGDKDKTDYYHIGLVDEDPRYVLNAQGTSTGFVRSPISQNWSSVAKLVDVDYDTNGGGDPVKTATVYADNGKPVNFRKAASTSAVLIDKLKVGTTVEVVEDFGDWMRVRVNGKDGYIVSNYLNYDDAPDETEDLEGDYDRLLDIQERLGEIVDDISDIIAGR